MNQLSNLLQLANFPMYGQQMGGMFPQHSMFGGGFQPGSISGGSGSAPSGPFQFQPSPVGPVSGGGGSAPNGPIGLRPSPWGGSGYGDGFGMNNLMMMHQLGRSGFGGY